DTSISKAKSVIPVPDTSISKAKSVIPVLDTGIQGFAVNRLRITYE
ncbi:MAG: hypothetical protein H6Q52_2820, partial [Deltaproteobacteria bacterium]|nr:hypothetical protein [Deltaproteobacteria bacterium]